MSNPINEYSSSVNYFESEIIRLWKSFFNLANKIASSIETLEDSSAYKLQSIGAQFTKRNAHIAIITVNVMRCESTNRRIEWPLEVHNHRYHVEFHTNISFLSWRRFFSKILLNWIVTMELFEFSSQNCSLLRGQQNIDEFSERTTSFSRHFVAKQWKTVEQNNPSSGTSQPC